MKPEADLGIDKRGGGGVRRFFQKITHSTASLLCSRGARGMLPRKRIISEASNKAFWSVLGGGGGGDGAPVDPPLKTSVEIYINKLVTSYLQFSKCTIDNKNNKLF